MSEAQTPEEQAAEKVANHDVPRNPEVEEEEEERVRAADTKLPPDVEKLQARVAELRDEVNADTQLIGQAQNRLKEKSRELDFLDRRLQRLLPKPSKQQPILDYLASQRKLREKRIALREKMHDTGMAELQKAAGPAPIDAVRRRRLGHGHQAKEHPFLNRTEG